MSTSKLLNAPFALDDPDEVILNRISENRFGDTRPQTGNCRPGGPKEARMRRVALLSPTKETEHLFPVKVRNIPRTASSEKLQDVFKDFGDIGDVYIPTSLKDLKPAADFAVIRFNDRKSAENAITAANRRVSVEGNYLEVSPLSKQKSKFSFGSGALGISNEPVDDGTRYKPAPPCQQAIKLESCMSRCGAPWGSVRELKYLAPHQSPEIDDMYSVRVEGLPYYTTAEDLRFVFSRFGVVGDVTCPKSLLVTERTKTANDGHALIRFADRKAAERAAHDVHNGRIIIDGHVLSARVLMPRYWPTEHTRRYY